MAAATTGSKITSFIGIVPVKSSRYVVLAVMDEPKGKALSSAHRRGTGVKSVMGGATQSGGRIPSQPIVERLLL